MLVMSYFMLGVLQMVRVATVKDRFDTTKSRMIEVKTALARFQTEKGRLPCPAALTDTSAATTFGRESYDGTTCTLAAQTGSGGATNSAYNNVMIGAVPFATLGLGIPQMVDAWGNRLIYAVSQNLASAATENKGSDYGQITLCTDPANCPATALGPIPQHTPYVLLSLGKAGRGGVSLEGKPGPNACSSTYTLEYPNCKLSGSTFITSAYSESTNAATAFNNITSNTLSDASNPTVVCGNKGMIYGPGHPTADGQGCIPSLKVGNLDDNAPPGGPGVNDGYVGIGTATPEGNLAVQQGIVVDQGDGNNGTNHIPGIEFGHNTGEGIASKRTVGGNQYGLDFYTLSLPRMSITNGGEVMIGTIATTPSSAPQEGNRLRFEGGRSYSPWDSFNSDPLFIERVNLASDVSELRVAIGDNYPGGSAMDFFTVGAFDPTMINWFPLFTVRSDGNVGIGTTNPVARLDVSGGNILSHNEIRVNDGWSPVQELAINSNQIYKANPTGDQTLYLNYSTEGGGVQIGDNAGAANNLAVYGAGYIRDGVYEFKNGNWTKVGGGVQGPIVYQCPDGYWGGSCGGGAWGFYGCTGQITTASTCTVIEYSNVCSHACTPLGHILITP